MSVIVFGSINLDLVARSPRIPAPGETLTGDSFETLPGGKGANQAVAVARLDVPTQLVGRVGGDAFGQTLLQGLRESGVGCDRVRIDPSTHSGVALITVDATSENSIVVIPGANGKVDQSDIDRLQAALAHNPAPTVLLLQLEIPLPMVIAAAHAAHAAGVTVILDPAPARSDLPDELYALIDIATPNQIEAGQLSGVPVRDFESAAQAAIVLKRRGVRTVIVKLGKAGALCLSESETFQIPSFPVSAVDTVGAGDAFNGGLAAAIATGMSFRQAITQAAAVAALSVTKAGAQPSLPTKAELAAFLARRDL
jgi:ribokinase